ncbi:unannotated protein [freshwater metagenome]|uniref:Unannotated protein n=1 Tax=freshwater metagenome TaxID=449393 RepID=A0A6J7MI11_9ZZZZ
MESIEPVGDKNEIVIAPFLSVFICAGVNGCTERTTSAPVNTSPDLTSAPAVLNS